MELAGPLVATFLASAGELWAGVPIGFALGLPPALVAVASAAGATAASGLVILVGAPIGTAIGIAFGAAPRPLLVWMTAGICLWSAALSAMAAFGIALVT